ncbi:autoinducer-2 kinase [Brachyspira pilosicoli]|uniref:autoinducer-2 kinase n=1 Tax=Brachyspira pilosicoli TaxID=52584 RepID=UPI0012F4D4CC|nr:autoinducer-2 kinase [Brachyspira pilosicoli]
MKYILALDAGTGSVRAVVFDISGNQIFESAKEYVHKINEKYPGSIDFDIENNWKLICDCIKDVLNKVSADDIISISTTSMREAFVLYDEKKQPIWACSNVDARAYEETIELRKNPSLEKDIYLLSGQTFSLCAIPRLLWIKRHEPDIYNRACYLNMISDWIAAELGADIFIDPSNGSTLGIFNLENRMFDKNILEYVDIESKFINSKVAESGTIIGEVSEKASKETGLKKGTKIVMGGGDASLGCIGVGSVNYNDAVILGGTFWQQEVNIPEAITDKKARIRVNCGSLKKLWQAEGIAFYPGLVARWFRDAFCEDLKVIAKEKNTNAYKLLSEKTVDIPAGSYGIIPIFSDQMNYFSWKHAAPSFINMTIDPEKTNRYSLFKSIMENAAVVSYLNIKMIEDFANLNLEKVTFAGGASKDPIWCQILADVLQLNVETTEVKEATALGAAMFASVGCGLYKDIYEAADVCVKKSRTFYPNKNNRKVYEDLISKFKEVYRVQLELADKNITTHMWKAAGE